MRKIISAMLVAAIILCMLPFGVGAGEIGAGDYTAGSDGGSLQGTYMPGRVIVKLAGTSDMSLFGDDLLNLGVDIGEMHNLNPFAPSSAGNGGQAMLPSSASMGGGKIYLLILGGEGSLTVEEAISILNANPMVEYAEPDYIFKLFSGPDDPYFDDQYALQAINTAGAWDVSTGSERVVVGIVDSGIDGTHPDIKDNLWVNPDPYFGTDIHGYNFAVDRGAGMGGIPFDSNGHGTAVAGVIGAKGNNGIGIAGVNWNVSLAWLGCDGGDGGISASAAIKATNYAEYYRIPVTINSYGLKESDFKEFPMALYETIAGYSGLFVAASGNAGENMDTAEPIYPACFDLPNIISVAATDTGNNLASFSNYGANSVHIAAPGERILTTFTGGGYAYMRGTSLAAPFVAGVAALMLSVNPYSSTREIKDMILSTANKDLTADTAKSVISGGVLDAGAAVLYAKDAIPGVVSFTNRLYDKILGRSASINEIDGWWQLLASGEQTGAQAAYGFFFSDEMAEKNLGNDEFVALLYEALMGRKPSPAELSGWLSIASSDEYRVHTREKVFYGFVMSDEFLDICEDAGINRGEYWPPTSDDISGFVTRTYNLCLGRYPGPAEMQTWVDDLESGRKGGTDIVLGFTNSAEFIDRRLTNRAFVEVLYNVFLGRPSDAAGRADWMDRLVYQERDQVLRGIAGSDEFAGICAVYGIRP